MALFKLLGVVLVSQGKRGMHFITLAISAAVNIVLNIFAIPHWGMYGAAWASVASYTVCGTVLTAYFCKLFDFRITELLIPSPQALKSILSKVKKKS
ncbi:MAG: polysaccharide biosynthesis C-terminal domain-containing protein [Clostridia bacterium]|nr:polysaccharide biosynthesis C-terminal domain-containing protein [Clostridia bacterium]